MMKRPRAANEPLLRALPAALLALLFVLIDVSPAEAQTPEDFAGTYSYAGGQRERTMRDQAIDRLIGQMNVVYRVIARRRLKAAAGIAPRLTIKANPDHTLSIKVGPGHFRTTKLDGTPIRFTNEKGQSIRLHRRFHKGVLTTVGTRGDAGQKNVYRLSPDRSRLTVSITITSEQLPGPLNYRASYHRE